MKGLAKGRLLVAFFALTRNESLPYKGQVYLHCLPASALNVDHDLFNVNTLLGEGLQNGCQGSFGVIICSLCSTVFALYIIALFVLFVVLVDRVVGQVAEEVLKVSRRRCRVSLRAETCHAFPTKVSLWLL